MPNPKQNENESEFVARCIPIVLNEGKEQEQASAICYSIWREHNNISETYQHTLESFDDKVIWILKCNRCKKLK